MSVTSGDARYSSSSSCPSPPSVVSFSFFMFILPSTFALRARGHTGGARAHGVGRVEGRWRGGAPAYEQRRGNFDSFQETVDSLRHAYVAAEKEVEHRALGPMWYD